MNNEDFHYHPRENEYSGGWGVDTPTPLEHEDIDGQPLETALDISVGTYSARYEAMIDKVDDSRGSSRRNPDHVDDYARSRDARQSERLSRFDDKYSPKHNRDYDDDFDRKPRSKAYGSEDSSTRRSQRSKSRERDRDRDSNRHSRDRERSRDHERRTRREDSGYGAERIDSDYRSRRRSRSRDRDRDRRYRESDRDRRHRDSDRERPRRDYDRERDRGEKESSPKDIPWVPPPLPQHLRHLQVQGALNPVSSGHESSSTPWATAQPPPLPVQNQFQNDGSFLEMFRQKMQKRAAPASDDSNTIEGPSASSVGETAEVAPAATPTLAPNSSGLPIIARRRISKILKTGVVQKKKKEEEEEPVEKEGDGWSSYMKEVQRYRANKCIENEASRPPLVK